MSNINSAYFIYKMPKIGGGGGANAPTAPPVPTPMSMHARTTLVPYGVYPVYTGVYPVNLLEFYLGLARTLQKFNF